MDEEELPEPTAFNPKQAAAYVNVSPRKLKYMRQHGGGPVWCRPSYKRVLYHRADLDAWLENARVVEGNENGV